MCVGIAGARLILPLLFKPRMDMSGSIVSVICCDTIGVTTCYRIACALLLCKRAPKVGLMRAECVRSPSLTGGFLGMSRRGLWIIAGKTSFKLSASCPLVGIEKNSTFGYPWMGGEALLCLYEIMF